MVALPKNERQDSGRIVAGTEMMIETHGLRKSFKSRRSEVQAVRGVDLFVREGEVFGFLGPNGAGKSTTLRILATLMKPDSGEATVAGYDLLREPARVRERIGYVSQTGGATSGATGRENLVLQAQLYGLHQSQARERARAMLDILSLSSIADRLVQTYSGGQKRRLDIALGLVHQPVLLFLDEPTTGLDPQSRATLWDEVRRLQHEGTTVFLTTHYLDEADALCDRLAIIDNGTIVAEDTPDALKHRISGDIVTLSLQETDGALAQAQDVFRRQSFVRETDASDGGLRLTVEHGEEALPVILRLLDGAGIGVRAIALARPTLDDVFLKLTGRSLREAQQAQMTPDRPMQAAAAERSAR
jgi:ABC-2 type transport system ATP-binding protein